MERISLQGRSIQAPIILLDEPPAQWIRGQKELDDSFRKPWKEELQSNHSQISDGYEQHDPCDARRRIVESGNHNTLIELGGLYFNPGIINANREKGT